MLIDVMTRIVAVLLGVIPAVALQVILLSGGSGLNFSSFVPYILVTFGTIAALHAAFGVAFGFAFPRPAWRWGLWLNIPMLLLLIIFLPIFLSSMVAGNGDFESSQAMVETLLFFGFFAGPLVAACVGAYAGARARRNFSSE